MSATSINLFIVPAVAILLVFFVLWQLRIYRQHLQSVLDERQLFEQKSFQLTAEVEELRAALLGFSQRIKQLEQFNGDVNTLVNGLANELQDLAEQQQKINLVDPDSKLYSRAMKMVQLGASLDEIIRECELPRAEAELLFNLHVQQNKS